jgi:2-iminobutanoate/2-iminopropanoate deaminase
VGEAIEEQTEQVCQNLKAILEAAGSSFDRVLQTTIYLTDFADFAGLNEIYGRYVGDKPPARATVQIAGLPMGAKVEIAVVAHR